MKSNRFLSIYLIIVLCQLATEIWFPVPSALYFIAKPCIMLSLIIHFWHNSGHIQSQPRLNFLFGLLFALLGDIFLMLQYQDSTFFLWGLGIFFLCKRITLNTLVLKIIGRNF